MKKGLELKQIKQTQLMTVCFILIYYVLREKNDKKTSCFNDLFKSLLKKVCERGAFSQ